MDSNAALLESISRTLDKDGGDVSRSLFVESPTRSFPPKPLNVLSASTTASPRDFAGVLALGSTSAPSSRPMVSFVLPNEPVSSSRAGGGGLVATLAPDSVASLPVSAPGSAVFAAPPSLLLASPSRVVSKVFDGKRESLDRIIYGDSSFKSNAESLLKRIIDLQHKLELESARSSPTPMPSRPSLRV